MHYIAFLLLWMPMDVGQPPIAAFVQHFPTYKACEDYRSRVKPEIRQRTSCMLVVVEPKSGIAE